ncbi:hypothetical protein VTI74DRAFT_11706 [Chaetomium olivicolor]
MAGMMEEQPEGLVVSSQWQMDPEVDPVKPVVIVGVICNGPLEEAREYAERIYALGPVKSASGVTDYPGLPAVVGSDMDGPECRPGRSIFFRGFNVNRYDLVALRNWFDLFSEMMTTEKVFRAVGLDTRGVSDAGGASGSIRAHSVCPSAAEAGDSPDHCLQRH